jgi:hypothetical protein
MHSKSEILELINQVRHICRGDLHKQPSQDAFLCLAIIKANWKAELKREPSDIEVRGLIDLGFKTLMAEVTHSA